MSTMLDASILDAKGRTEDDHYRDAGFKPLEVYGFLGIGEGATVGDLMTSRGYNAHILAGVVGNSGRVLAILTFEAGEPDRMERSRQRFAEGPAGAAGFENLEIVDSLADIPDDSLDVLLTVRNYHDLGTADERRAAVPALLRVLKPGSTLGVIDAYTNKPDERDESVHRINDELAKAEITAGGFEFVAASDVLHNADDTFDFDGRERAGRGDSTEDAPIHRYYVQRFVQKYSKPAAH